MLIGVNWISPQTLPIIERLLAEGIADFCEVMVDNFIHLPASSIRAALPDVPIGLHIVASRFLEKSQAELDELAHALRPWIREINPFYVSDHLVQFTTSNGQHLPFTTELPYQKSYSHVMERVNRWQTLLDTQLFFENYASLSAAGKGQVDFFEKLVNDTQAGLLFDFSNAYVAERNGACEVKAWDVLAQKAKHFHVAGFAIEPATQLAIDTHDQDIAATVIALMKRHFHSLPHLSDATLVVEFEAAVNFAQWQTEILKIKNELTQ